MFNRTHPRLTLVAALLASACSGGPTHAAGRCGPPPVNAAPGERGIRAAVDGVTHDVSPHGGAYVDPGRCEGCTPGALRISEGNLLLELGKVPQAAGTYAASISVRPPLAGSYLEGDAQVALDTAPDLSSELLSGTFSGEVRSKYPDEPSTCVEGSFSVPFYEGCTNFRYIPRLDNDAACPRCPQPGELACEPGTPYCEYHGESWVSGCACTEQGVWSCGV